MRWMGHSWKQMIWIRTKREQEKANKDIEGETRARKAHGEQNKTQDRTQVWHLLPPPGRRVPRHTTSNGEGRWALWRPQGTGWLDGRLPGPTAEQGARVAMAGQPQRPRPQPLRLEPYYPPPPKKNTWGNLRGWTRGLEPSLGLTVG